MTRDDTYSIIVMNGFYSFLGAVMSKVVDFTSEVFAFIETTYGKGCLRSVKAKKNQETVDKILEDSKSKEYSTDRTANKIVAMLRLNP